MSPNIKIKIHLRTRVFLFTNIAKLSGLAEALTEF